MTLGVGAGRTAALALVAVAALGGCATADRKRHETLVHSLAGDYIYDQGLDLLWPEVRQLLLDNGYVEPKESPDEYVIITDWKTPLGDGQIVGYWSRYLVQGEQLDAEHCIIRFLRHDLSSDSMPEHASMGYGAYTRHWAQGYSEIRRLANGMSWGARDLKMEFLLLERVKPDVAAQFDALATRRLGF